MNKIDSSKAWIALKKHSKKFANFSVKDQFTCDSTRFDKFSLKVDDVTLDYSKNKIIPKTIDLLCDLAITAKVAQYRDEMFGGAKINTTENRAVLHTALRNINSDFVAENILVKNELARIAKFVNEVRGGKWRGSDNREITDIVNIGIGGSHLGPAMATEALKPYSGSLKIHFVSNVDATSISETLKILNPQTTLFIIVSKTFTTQEVLANAITAREWLLNNLSNEKKILKHHFIAVTTKPELAIDFGVPQENIFLFWDWVGGRFSLWSAVGISIALSVGMENFYKLLAGAHAMDRHFCNAPIKNNMPIILALLGIWNINFLNTNAHAVIPYDEYLKLLPAYLGQLEMESNGKRVRTNGEEVSYNTAPIILGGIGTDSQHSFHQLLMQGTRGVSVDFIMPIESHNPIGNHHLFLYANCLAQSRALMCGCNKDDLVEVSSKLAPHKIIPGNVANNVIVIEKINPFSLGLLLALYEHKVFVQGIIWGINSFDQWGVELGKHIANRLLPELQDNLSPQDLDPSTSGLIKLYRDSNNYKK